MAVVALRHAVRDTYVPLLHLSVAAIASLTSISAAHAYHIVTAVTYSLGAVALFFMAMRLGAGRGAAFLAALTYSLFSPSALLEPGVAADIGGWFHCRRLQVLTVYGEGPHVTSLALLMLAVLALQHAIETRTARSFTLASLALAALFLTNIPGTMATGLAVFCWIAVQPSGRRARAWPLAAGASALAYGIACYGVPPSTLATVLANSSDMHGGFHLTLHKMPYLLPALLLAVAAAGYRLGRTRLPLYVTFGILYLALMLVLVDTPRGAEFELLPQVRRLHLEMEIPACLLIGAFFQWLYQRSRRWAKLALVAIAIAAAAVQIYNYRAWTRAEIRRTDPANRSEYASAHWLDTHLHGQRVYASGTDGFWLEAFSDSPQVEGCCDQGLGMPILRIVPYIVSPNVNPEQTKLSVSYLEALGAQAFVVSGPQSTEEYKSVQAPERYATLLPVLARIQGETIYGVPQRAVSPAHVLHANEAIREAAPPDLVRYASAIEDASRPPANLEWLDPGTARIRAVLQRDDLISVQVAWFSGWKVTANGHPRPTSADGLGFILIRPECQGDCEIALTWTGTPDLKICTWISGLAVGLAIVLLAVNPRLSRSAKTP